MSDLEPVYENKRVVDLEEIVRELGELGLSVDTIAKSTRSTPDQVRSILVAGRVHDGVEEKRLEDDFRRLMQASIREAFKVVQFGPSEQRMKIITAMLTNTGRAVGKDAKSPNDDMRSGFRQLMEEMTEVANAPQTQAIAQATDDRYEEARAEEAGPRLYRPDRR